MERNSPVSQGYKLESQIREAFGRITYSQTCRDKIVHRLEYRNEAIKVLQIILSALTTGSFLVTIISNENISGIIGAVLSLCLLVLNSYVKNLNLSEVAQKHQKASDLLWKIREEYVSLLVDFEILEQDSIILKRDELQERTFDIYSNSIRTDVRSYRDAQRALKTKEEQTFSENEIDILLPEAIRRNQRNYKEETQSTPLFYMKEG